MTTQIPLSGPGEEITNKRRRVDSYYDDKDAADMARLTERDELTLMVRSLHPKTGEFDLFELFSTIGKVNDVKLISDQSSGKSVGVAYVEMADANCIEPALGLSGRTLCGAAIVVQRSLAVKNRLASKGANSAEIMAAGRLAGGFDPGYTDERAAGAARAEAKVIKADAGQNAQQPSFGIKIYVGGLDFAFTESEVKEIFKVFGPLEAVHLQRDPITQASKGFAFIHFTNPADGLKCCKEMDGLSLAGRAIKVNVSGNTTGEKVYDPSQLAPQLNAASAAAAGLNPTSLMIGSGNEFNQGTTVIVPAVHDHNAVTNLDGLDTSQGTGEKINASQRANLLMKLAASADMVVPEQTRKAAAQTGYSIAGPGGSSELGGSDSRCVVLKNLFDRLSEEAQSNPKFFEELADDVRGECSKLGTVLFCAADKWSNGFVFLKMLANAEASRVVEVMHGRYFAKNKILASYVPEAELDKKFKLAATMSGRAGGFAPSYPPMRGYSN